MSKLLTTREVAAFLSVNEKMIYSLVGEKGLPATKVTGKWLFPQHLVEQWIENNTSNFPGYKQCVPAEQGLIIVAGSNDILLEKMMTLYNTTFANTLVSFANVGSMGGVHALRQGLCHIAASHIMQENGNEYNFQFALEKLEHLPVVVNFCRRSQGIVFRKDNPFNITSVTDLQKNGLRFVNRPLGTGTRLLVDTTFKEEGISCEKITGYDHEVGRHLDVGLEILAGRADAGPAIEAVAGLLDLGFLALRKERFDLLVPRNLFFEKTIQQFLGLINHSDFIKVAASYAGYDLQIAGQMVFQADSQQRHGDKN